MVKVYKDFLTEQQHRTFDVVGNDNQIIHSDVHLIDKTIYTQQGDKWGAKDINDLNTEIVSFGNRISTVESGINSVVEDKVLSNTNWTGSIAPFSYVLSVIDVTLTSIQEILPGLNITAEQLTALQAANIQDGGQANGNITLKAFGDKPTIDIPIRVIKRGVK